MIFAVSAGFSACADAGGFIVGNGDVISQERTASGFNGIEFNGAGNINIHFAENYRVVVTTDSNIQDIVIVKVNNNFLSVGFTDKNLVNNLVKTTKLETDVYLPEIKTLRLNGVGNITIDAGSGEHLETALHGVGNINASDYQVKKATVDLAGVGDIKIWAAEELSGGLSGVGDILYKGNPARNINISGFGNIKPTR